MKMSKKLISLFLCLILSLSCIPLMSCGEKDDGTQPEDPITISLDKTEYTISADEELYLEVTTNSKDSVSWSSSDKAVASVDSSGRVLTKKAGVVTITASIGDTSASCTLTVTESAAQDGAKLIADEKCMLSLKDGAVKLSAKYIKDGNTDSGAVITYRSSDESIVTVSADGTVTPVSLGTAVIVLECEGTKTSVVADVYTASISTAEEWLAMIKDSCSFPEKATTTDRFYLKNDIDFTGVEYDIGDVAYGANSDQSNPYHFASEVNGNYHTVKNITSWKSDPEKNPENHQSIFGRTIGATVKNIAFENIVFNSANSYGLSSVMMHHFSNMSGVGSISNLFENISADFIYDFDPVNGKGNRAVGVTANAYGTNLKNVFVHMHSSDDTPLTDRYDNVYGFAYAEWVWYGGSLSNVIVLIEDVPMGEAEFINDGAGDPVYKHSKTNCYAVNTVTQAAYYANKCLDQSVWDVMDPVGIPKFIR